MADTIKVALTASKELVISAKGNPALIVAAGAAGALIVATAGLYQGGKLLVGGVQKLLASRGAKEPGPQVPPEEPSPEVK